MANLQVKGIPEELHERLRERAALERCTLSDLVLRSVARELERGEWLSRLRDRAPVDLEVPAGRLVAEERRARDPTSSR